MHRTATSSRPLTARLLAVCAVVAGLFLMHGSPAAAAGGCHGTTAGSPPMTQAPAAMSVHADAPSAGHFAGSPHAAPYLGPAGTDGTLCVSTPAHPSPVPPAAGALAVVACAAWEPLGRRLAAVVTRWRGPPGEGRGVLLRVGVART
ncbi:hypothetical protein [Streptomyces chattanoogensis]|uniref:hypothetical protein n=1 Tax=Streptomyces chattanoogensis TaxID=66876 RepID=UPI000A79EF2E|nr:hypothetical protein [Streptomyces chattanoogensis]